jgi:hypothetical protein
MQNIGRATRSVPQVGDRVIRVEAMDFAPARVIGISPSGRMLQAAYEDGSEVCAPATAFLVVPETYRPPPPRSLSQAHQLELMYDGEIPPGLTEAAARVDASPAALAGRWDEAAAWLAWLASDLHPLDPTRFAEPLARARAALTAATAAELAALMAAA